ncbi:hypothetical protein SSP24_37000 [Streptomyces spinoverrucosus]|uniref:Uncharacterized protein n=1 Tax=Streptomyces spinoverrucosus TaxID=284043 RepID=A0A4Y3VIP3_9ACTN|nr:hypothetical protein SSP24_37000 [Streptomyces spinoverrucosus]GHB90221.1 hypothetical protein GCM10010397_73090 [Streptomyces spinoverrucosus]
MNRRGRRAALPPGDHARPEPLDPGGLVVRHVDRNGRVRAYDFATLPVAEPMQRSLAVLFAARCHPNRWGSHRSSRLMFELLEKFTVFLSGLERPPRDVEELTTAQVKQWRLSEAGTAGGYNAITRVGSLLRQDARLVSGPVADELAVRTQRPKSQTQSYSEEEFDRIKRAARRTFRAALLCVSTTTRRTWSGGGRAPSRRAATTSSWARRSPLWPARATSRAGSARREHGIRSGGSIPSWATPARPRPGSGCSCPGWRPLPWACC